MNNFNNIFIVVKRHCGERGIVDGNDIFEKIADETSIPLHRLIFMLNTLQDLELIKFSTESGFIKLTPFGRKQERLFTDVF